MTLSIVSTQTRITALALAAVLVSAAAASAQEPYKPVVGQAGKDAVWVPTTEAMVEKMLDVAKVTPNDYVMDLGSGDGRMIIAAAKRGVPGQGVEYNEGLVALSKKTAADLGLSDKATFVQGDMYAADISKATVLALFLLPSNIEKLVPKFLDLKPGSRIVANTFWVEDWTPDETVTMTENCDSWCTVKLFVIPAKAEGTWRFGAGDLKLTQKYQMVSGTFVTGDGQELPARGRLLGNKLSITVGDQEYDAKIEGDVMEGSPKDNPAEVLRGTRVK